MQFTGRSRIRIGGSVLAATILGAAMATTGGAATAGAAPTPGTVYVALGDSYSAGSVVPPLGEALTCGRSAQNYPALVAAALGVGTFRDVTCGSAKTTHLLNPQPGNVAGVAAPQYDALTADTTLVTVGIGGNDVGLIDAAYSCINPLPEPIGRSCADANTASGRDLYADKVAAFAPTYRTVIEQIRSRSPQARIALVGYPSIARPGGCLGQPMWPRDMVYLQSVLTKLNQAMAAQAAANGVTYVDVSTSSVGHDFCAAPADRWVEGVVPSDPTGLAPLHPNAAGQANYAQQVLAALG